MPTRCDFESDPFAEGDGGQCENEATIKSTFRRKEDGTIAASMRCDRCATLTNWCWECVETTPIEQEVK
jgi:hypothetical protein